MFSFLKLLDRISLSLFTHSSLCRQFTVIWCMDYIEQQSMHGNYLAVHRCLDLLEIRIECTRTGAMRREYCSNDTCTISADKLDQIEQ